MSPLSQESLDIIKRLREYRPPSPSIYSSLPLKYRAAVLILLFADRRGDLKIVLTVRSRHLRTFPGQVAFPGGRADHVSETPAQTARREAFEEIGLPLDGHTFFPPSFSVEHITELPCYLARSILCVRPCVALLNDNSIEKNGNVEELMVPRLQEKEVSSVFTLPLQRFLHRQFRGFGSGEEDWYRGQGMEYSSGGNWRAHEFLAPVLEKNNTLKTHRIWGMTARILVDLARIAHGRDPEYEFDQGIGEETLMKGILDTGRWHLLNEIEKKPDQERHINGIEKGNL